jgi:hypothetical protein
VSRFSKSNAATDCLEQEKKKKKGKGGETERKDGRKRRVVVGDNCGRNGGNHDDGWLWAMANGAGGWVHVVQVWVLDLAAYCASMYGPCMHATALLILTG